MKTLTSALVAALLVGPALAQAPGGSKTGPRIRVEPASFDFGKAAQNKTLRKEFSVRNFGTEDLVIDSVTTSCGCTAALTESRVVKPGGSTPLRVSLETRASNGRVQRSVIVKSNDPRDPLLEVKLEVLVEAGQP